MMVQHIHQTKGSLTYQMLMPFLKNIKSIKIAAAAAAAAAAAELPMQG